MELAEGRDGMCESGGVVPSNGNEFSEAASQTHDAGSLARVPAGMGPKPCLWRSKVELRVTDNALAPHTNCISFEDLGVLKDGEDGA